MLEVYSFGQLQDFVTMLDTLASEGHTVEDLKQHVQEEIKQVISQTEGEPIPVRNCDCGEQLMLLPVNQGDRDQTDDNTKSVWQCPKCHEQEFSELTMEEQIEKYGTTT